MQRLTHNLKAPTVRRRFSAAPNAAIVYLLVLLLATPVPLTARPATVGEVTSLSSFKALMLVIANLNRAMESAAQNPQDDWRRQDAARAFSALPPAIIGLAQDFKAGKLGNEDLPMVQAMLGSFVNKNAADNFKQFMKSPSKNLIPQVSPQLASMLPKPTGGGSSAGQAAVASAKAAPSTANTDGTTGATAGPANPQILSLSDPGVMTAPAAGKDQSQSISYDEGAAKQKVGSSSTDNVAPATADTGVSGGKLASLNAEFGGNVVGGNAGTAAPATGATNTASGSAPAARTTGDAISELRQVEVNMITAPAAASAPAPAVKEDPDKAQFFAKIKVGQDENDEKDDDASTDQRHAKKKQGGSRRPASVSSPRTELSPKYFNVRPLVIFAERLLIEEAHAEGGDGGGKEGGSAAEILYGLAAIMAAAAPIAVASIQASADKYIAKTNADAQIKMTNITSDTSKYLADQQKSIALQQADIAQAVNKSNNDYVTQRLQMQLSELSNARHEAEAAEQQKLAIEQQYNNQRIALAQQQADQNVKLAQQTLNAQLTQLGLTSGAINSRNSGDRLTSSSTFGVPSGGTSASIGAQVGGIPQTSGLVASASGRGTTSAADALSRGSAGNTRDAMSFSGDRGVTAYNLGSNNAGTYQSGAGNRGLESGGAAEIPPSAPVAPVAAPAALTAANFSGNRGAVESSSGGGGDSFANVMKDLQSAGDTSGIGAPAPVQQLVQGDLSKGNEALLANVHQPGADNHLRPRNASLNNAFESVGTVADARGNRGGKRGAGRSRLSASGRRGATYTVDESRILSYLRSQSSSPRALNGSTPENRFRIVTPNAPGSDLGLFTRAAEQKSPADDFVSFREALNRNSGSALRARGAERGPASIGRGGGEGASQHKRQ